MFTLFRERNLALDGSSLHRKANRAIIFQDGLSLLVRSEKYGEYKFPGGGQEEGESTWIALEREVLEETGYHVNPVITPYGKTIEYAKDFEGKFDLFVQESDYYLCQIEPLPQEALVLDDYEVLYGYQPVWIRLEEAILHNLALPSNRFIPWKERDTLVMKRLLEEKKNALHLG